MAPRVSYGPSLVPGDRDKWFPLRSARSDGVGGLPYQVVAATGTSMKPRLSCEGQERFDFMAQVVVARARLHEKGCALTGSAFERDTAVRPPAAWSRSSTSFQFLKAVEL